MQANRSRDTAPELRLRRALHGVGLRYRVCARPMPELRRTADIVFRPAKVAVELYGCYWHACPEHFKWPKSNSEYWQTKIQRNMTRDAENRARLALNGWDLVVVWEHEDAESATARVLDALKRSAIGFRYDGFGLATPD